MSTYEIHYGGDQFVIQDDQDMLALRNDLQGAVGKGDPYWLKVATTSQEKAWLLIQPGVPVWILEKTPDYVYVLED